MLPEEIEGQIPLKEEVKITLENKKFYCILLGNYKEQRIIDIGPLTMLKEDLEDPINYRFSKQYKYSDITDIQLRFPPKEPDKNNNK